MKKKKDKGKEKPDKLKKAKHKGEKDLIRFCITFAVLLVILLPSFSYFVVHSDITMGIIENFTAQVSGFFLNILQFKTSVNGKHLTSPNYSCMIVAECTGVFEMMILLAGVLAYPTNFRKKLWGILLGCLILYATNVFRIILLVIVGNFSIRASEMIHLWVWQVINILIVIAICLFWIEKVVKRERKASLVHS
jgi:archaeosortase B (VPXXXP-CTERM-specific)